MSWIDDNLIVGSQEAVVHIKEELVQGFDCNDCGEMDEYVGNKIEKLPSGGIKFTQNVIIQSFCNEFKLPDGNANTPAVPGDILTSAPESPSLEKEQKTYFRSGFRKLIYLKQWSRPEISNATRDAVRHM